MERRTRAPVIGAIAGAIVLAIAAAVTRAATVQQRGTFALLGGTPKIVSFAASAPSSGSTVALTIRQFRLDGKTAIVSYDVDMQKLIHLIIVRDDFGEFMHLHPTFDPATGTFRRSFPKDAGRSYVVYADTMPHGIGQQVFRFTVGADGLTHASQPSPRPYAAAASPPRVSAGPYSVVLARTTLPANREQSVDLTVLKHGRPARDLAPYLGAAAHAVFIDASTLAYLHVHPTLRGAPAVPMGGMEMNAAAQAGPLMTMQVPPLPAGTYKLWIEFGGTRGAVYVAPFTIRVA